MTIMLSCLKSNNYQEVSCDKEIKSFNECFSTYKVNHFIVVEKKGLAIKLESSFF